MGHAIFKGVDLAGAEIDYYDSIYTISYSPDGLRIASGGDRRQIPIWNSRSGREVLCCDGHVGSVQAVVFNPLGDFLASGGGDNYVRIWDTHTGHEIWSRKLHKNFVRGLSYDSTGQWLASVGQDGRLIIWEARTGEKYFELKEPSPILCVTYSPNSSVLATGTRNGTLAMWDAQTMLEVGRWQAHKDVLWVAFSHDSSLLISSGIDDTNHLGREVASIKVWEGPTWRNRLIMNFDYTGGWIHGSINSHKPYVAVQTGANAAAIWNYQTGEQVFRLKGHYATVYSTQFSPDGRYLASSSDDGSIRLWDVRTGACVRHIIQRKDCEGARLTDIKGLDTRACEWLRDRGATIKM